MVLNQLLQIRDDQENKISIPLGIDDIILSGNGKEWESPCTWMGMALIPMGINSHRRMQCLAYVIVITYSEWVVS